MSQIALRKHARTTVQLSAITGRLADIAIDLTKFTLVVFDGVTAGGIPLALEDHSHGVASGIDPGFMSTADYVYLYSHTHTNATTLAAGFMSATDKAKLDGIPPGGGGSGGTSSSASIANTLVLRNAAADFAAHDITANKFIGPLQGNADTATDGVVTSGSYADPVWITSLAGSKITGTIGAGVTFLGSTPWTAVTGKPSVVSYFTNDAGYINGSGNTTGTSGGVLSVGGRETVVATANTVILRDASGRAKVATPVAASDIATKAYVDAAGSPTIQHCSVFLPYTGFDSVDVTVTISSVNTSKTVIMPTCALSGNRTTVISPSGAINGLWTANLVLTNSTTVTLNVRYPFAAWVPTDDIPITFDVITYA